MTLRAVRLAVETSLRARPFEPSLLEDGGHLLGVGIDCEVAERLDELVEVLRRLGCLDGIGLRTGSILGGQDLLRERVGAAVSASSSPPHPASVTSASAVMTPVITPSVNFIRLPP